MVRSFHAPLMVALTLLSPAVAQETSVTEDDLHQELPAPAPAPKEPPAPGPELLHGMR